MSVNRFQMKKEVLSTEIQDKKSVQYFTVQIQILGMKILPVAGGNTRRLVETLQGQFTAYSDLQSPNSVLSVKLQKGEGRAKICQSVTSSVLHCMCQHPSWPCFLQRNNTGAKEAVKTEYGPLAGTIFFCQAKIHLILAN